MLVHWKLPRFAHIPLPHPPPLKGSCLNCPPLERTSMLPSSSSVQYRTYTAMHGLPWSRESSCMTLVRTILARCLPLTCTPPSPPPKKKNWGNHIVKSHMHIHFFAGIVLFLKILAPKILVIDYYDYDWIHKTMKPCICLELDSRYVHSSSACVLKA